MRWLIDEFRRQTKDRIAVSIVCEIPLLYVCYVIASWIWTILTVDDEERLRHSLNYVDWIEIPPDVLAALLIAIIVLNIIYVCIARRQRRVLRKKCSRSTQGFAKAA